MAAAKCSVNVCQDGSAVRCELHSASGVWGRQAHLFHVMVQVFCTKCGEIESWQLIITAVNGDGATIQAKLEEVSVEVDVDDPPGHMGQAASLSMDKCCPRTSSELPKGKKNP